MNLFLMAYEDSVVVAYQVQFPIEYGQGEAVGTVDVGAYGEFS